MPLRRAAVSDRDRAGGLRNEPGNRRGGPVCNARRGFPAHAPRLRGNRDLVWCSPCGERSFGEVGGFDNFEVAGGVEVHDVNARDAGHFLELLDLLDADS